MADCCCLHPDARECYILRFEGDFPREELVADVRLYGGCQCGCHHKDEDEDEGEDG